MNSRIDFRCSALERRVERLEGKDAAPGLAESQAQRIRALEGLVARLRRRVTSEEEADVPYSDDTDYARRTALGDLNELNEGRGRCRYCYGRLCLVSELGRDHHYRWCPVSVLSKRLEERLDDA